MSPTALPEDGKASFSRNFVSLEYRTMDKIETPINPKEIQSWHFGKFLSLFSVVLNEFATNYKSDLLCHDHLILMKLCLCLQFRNAITEKVKFHLYKSFDFV
jgi:hypothetical protein